MKVLYIDASSGAAGDMFLGALVDAGADRDAVTSALDALGLEGWSLRFEETTRAGLRALRAVVATTEQRFERRFSDIETLLRAASLPEAVRARALGIFRLLAAAEARVHGVDVSEVHFHEVGALDAIVDIVGTAAALEDLAPQLVFCSAVTVGTGSAGSAHGELPVPPPAVAELLRVAPVRFAGEGELVTPTGAAILAASVSGWAPELPIRVSSIGYGAGARDTQGRPNVLRVMVGEVETIEAASDHLLLETNLDDMSPELIPYAIERLLAAGAQDAWTTPIVMKKGRPAVTLSILCRVDSFDAVLDVLYSETTTLGVRIRPTGKHELERSWTTVTVRGHDIRVKIATHRGKVVNVAPEHEDCASAARATGAPLKDIYAEARFLCQNSAPGEHIRDKEND